MNYGLQPSPLCAALLRQDKQDAWKNSVHDEIDNIPEMLEIVAETVPVELFSSDDDIARWCAHEGLKGADPVIWAMFKSRFSHFDLTLRYSSGQKVDLLRINDFTYLT